MAVLLTRFLNSNLASLVAVYKPESQSANVLKRKVCFTVKDLSQLFVDIYYKSLKISLLKQSCSMVFLIYMFSTSSFIQKMSIHV